MEPLEIVKNSAWSDRSLELDKLAPALCKAQSEIEGAKKGSVNPHFRSKYADLGAVWDAVREPLTKNGLSVIQEPQSANGRLVLTTTLIHTSGQYIRSSLDFPVPTQNPQGYGSAITYARRYSLQAICGIAPEDDDGNAASIPTHNIQPTKAAPKPAINLDNWTGNEIIKGGKNDGKAWKDLSGDTIQWYIDNSKSPAIKAMAERELQRREESGMSEFNQDEFRGVEQQ